MKTREQVSTIIIEVVRSWVTDDKVVIDKDLSLTPDGGVMDSLDMVEVLMEVEDEFRIAFEDEESQGLKTLDDLVNLAFKKVEAKG